MKQQILVAGFLSMAALCAAPAFAADAGTIYLGGNVGQSSTDYSSDKCSQDVGFDCTTDTSDTAIKLNAGYHITPQLAAEMGYIDMGKVNLTFPQFGSAGGEIKSHAIYLDAVGTLPLQTGGLALTGRIGLFSSDTTFSVHGGGGSASDSQSASDLNFGVGLEMPFNKNLSGKLELERFDSVGKGGGNSGANISVFSVGINYSFNK